MLQNAFSTRVYSKCCNWEHKEPAWEGTLSVSLPLGHSPNLEPCLMLYQTQHAFLLISVYIFALSLFS